MSEIFYKRAYYGLLANPIGKNGIKQLNEIRSNILHNPFVQNSIEKLS